MKIYYLAHPVAPCEKYTLEDNLDHALHMLALLDSCDIKAVVPWLADCLAFDDNDAAARERRIAIDLETVHWYHGIIATGHKISSGMLQEINILLPHQRLVNLVGMPDDLIRSLFIASSDLATAMAHSKEWLGAKEANEISHKYVGR